MRRDVWMVPLIYWYLSSIRGGSAFVPHTGHGSAASAHPRDLAKAYACTGKRGTGVAAASPSSVYINLPFCRRRCFYCDFPIKVVGDRPGAAADAARPYVDNVIREIRTTAAEAVGKIPGDLGFSSGQPRGGDEDGVHVNLSGRNSAAGRILDTAGVQRQHGGDGVKTLFFGGGTPSLCPPELVGSLIRVVRELYGIAAGAEISIEMDPGTFDEARLGEFLQLGITRVSMGVQSFDAGLLEACGRAHSLADVYEAVELLHRAGMHNFSIDLMSGLPRQTVHQWENTLVEAISTGAAHISVYDLQVEAGTPFGRWFAPGEAPLPEDDTCAHMYRTASRVLGQAGYDHYEISNYARPGFQSRHNRAYWENVPFLAFGNGAASYIDGHRFSRPRGLPEYRQWVDKLAEEGWARATGAAAATAATALMDGEDLVSRGGSGGEDEGKPSSAEALERDALLDDVMLGFRLREGLDLEAVASKFGLHAVRRVEEGVTEGLTRGWVVRDRSSGVGGVSDTEEASSSEKIDGDAVGGHRSDSVGGDPLRVEAGGDSSDEGGDEGRSPGVASGGGSPRGGLGRLRLSDPEGFLFSNSVISSVFCELDDWHRSREETGEESPALR